MVYLFFDFISLILIILSMREAIIQKLESIGISPELTVFLIALLPVVELRGAIPVGINLYHLAWYKASLLALIGNILPVPFLLLFLGEAAKFLSKIPLFRRFFDWLFTRTRKKSKRIEEYKFLGLMVFVAIPLPGTGAWTGSVAAFLLGMDFGRSLMAIALGVLLAGILVTGLSLLGPWGGVIAFIFLTIIIISQMAKKKR